MLLSDENAGNWRDFQLITVVWFHFFVSIINKLRTSNVNKARYRIYRTPISYRENVHAWKRNVPAEKQIATKVTCGLKKKYLTHYFCCMYQINNEFLIKSECCNSLGWLVFSSSNTINLHLLLSIKDLWCIHFESL